MPKTRTLIFRALGAFALALALVATLRAPAHAVLAAVSTNPDGSVLVNAGNGFPLWYQDTAGVALEQCNFTTGGVQDGNCIPAGAATGFVDFEEAFWWAGEALLTAGGVDARLTLALEAAFLNGNPVDTQQIVFGRVRVRADVPAAGTYTVTHPYGVQVYEIDAVGPGDEIFDTVDIGGGALDFTTVLDTGIGPFLTCVSPAPPDGYLGNFAVPCTVTGSPFNTNFLRIEGPGVDVSTTSFSVSGKIFAGIVPLPATVERATHRCDAAGNCALDVFVTSTAQASVSVASAPPGAFAATPLAHNGAGGFYGAIPVSAAALPVPVDELDAPALQIAATASAPGFTDVTVQRQVADVVDIRQATYNLATGILTLEAASGDPRAALSEGLLGQLPPGVLRADLNGTGTGGNPPAHVNVVSNAGGRASKTVTIVNEAEALVVARARYIAGRHRYVITGTSTAIGATVLVGLEGGANSGQVIGSAVVDEAGAWKIVARTPPAPARARARQVRAVSSGGANVVKRLVVLP